MSRPSFPRRPHSHSQSPSASPPSPPHAFPDMTSTTLILSHFANFKLAGDRVVRDTVASLNTPSTHSELRPQSHRHHRRHRRRPRPQTSRSARVNTMSDADLEAELAARRAARARERDRYARAMRSEKLVLLEGELARLRSEIARLDHGATSAPASVPLGSGKPPTVRWASLPQAKPKSGPSASSAPAGTGLPPVPPRAPPPMPLPGSTEEPAAVDPEKQRREKEERQKRREMKRKEREAAKKPLTLAEIIKSAGPDPMRRLRPSGSTALPVLGEEEAKVENLAGARDGLKKVDNEEDKKDEGEGAKVGEKDSEKNGESAKSAEGKTDAKGEEKGDDAASTMDPKEEKEKEKEKEAGEKQSAVTAESETSKVDDSAKAIQPSKAEESKMNTTKEAILPKDTSNDKDASTQDTRSEGAEAAPSTEPKASDNDVKIPADGMNDTGSIAAVAALAANLPQRKNSTTSRKTRPGKSLEERRRARKAEAAKKEEEGEVAPKANLADVLAAANALKLD